MNKSWIFLLIGLFFINTAAMAQKETKDVVKFVIHTDYGDMKGTLYNETPQHRDNFVKLVKEGFYNDLLFHRVIPGFMIQGGDPDSKNAQPGQPLGSGGPGYTVPAEFNSKLIHKKGAIAAARQGDQVNPQKASSGSQFYIVMGRTFNAPTLQSMEAKSGIVYTPEQVKIYETEGGYPPLDGAYTVYGEITEGLDVIDKIANVKRDQRDRPVEDVKMKIELID